MTKNGGDFMIKRKLRRLCATALLLICMATTVCNAKTPKLPKGVYAHMAMVTEVKKLRKGKRNLIIAVDGANRKWSWYNASEYWCKGDFAAMIMYNNGTKCVYDDIIIGEPRYVGFKELF